MLAIAHNQDSVAMMVDDAMEFSTEHNMEAGEEDIDIDFDIETAPNDGDAILADIEAGADHDALHNLESSLQAETDADDVMLDEESASYTMDDVEALNQADEMEHTGVTGEQQGVEEMNMDAVAHDHDSLDHDGGEDNHEGAFRVSPEVTKDSGDDLQLQEIDEAENVTIIVAEPVESALTQGDDLGEFRNLEQNPEHNIVVDPVPKSDPTRTLIPPDQPLAVAAADDIAQISGSTESTHDSDQGSDAVTPRVLPYVLAVESTDLGNSEGREHEPIGTRDDIASQVMVHYETRVFPLVRTSAVQNTDDFFFEDCGCVDMALSGFLRDLRGILNDDFRDGPDEYELRLVVEELDLEINEAEASNLENITLRQLIDLYGTLSRNDGNTEHEPLVLLLQIRQCFSKRLEKLNEAANGGQALSEVTSRTRHEVVGDVVDPSEHAHSDDEGLNRQVDDDRASMDEVAKGTSITIANNGVSDQSGRHNGDQQSDLAREDDASHLTKETVLSAADQGIDEEPPEDATNVSLRMPDLPGSAEVPTSEDTLPVDTELTYDETQDTPQEHDIISSKDNSSREADVTRLADNNILDQSTEEQPEPEENQEFLDDEWNGEASNGALKASPGSRSGNHAEHESDDLDDRTHAQDDTTKTMQMPEAALAGTEAVDHNDELSDDGIFNHEDDGMNQLSSSVIVSHHNIASDELNSVNDMDDKEIDGSHGAAGVHAANLIQDNELDLYAEAESPTVGMQGDDIEDELLMPEPRLAEDEIGYEDEDEDEAMLSNKPAKDESPTPVINGASKRSRIEADPEADTLGSEKEAKRPRP